MASNRPIVLDHDDQRDHLVLVLTSQDLTISLALIALSKKTADPTYDQAEVDDLVLQQNLIEARISEIKNEAPFKYPSDAEITALGKACDVLQNMDMKTAAVQSIVVAANEVVAALPVSSTK
jgi:hypothetical protein